MDPVTHTLVGAGLAQTGLKRVSPRATVTLLLAANAPDIDALTMLISRDLSLGARRGWTHGILAMVLLPILLAGLVWLVSRLAARGESPAWHRDRRGARPARREEGAYREYSTDEQRRGAECIGGRMPRDFHHGLLTSTGQPTRDPDRFGPILALAALGILTHPLLDWLNTYGVRLLMPFDGRWFYGDALFIVDPWVWLLAAAPVVLATTGRPTSRVAWLLGAAAASWLVLGTPLAPASTKIAWGLGLAALAGLRLRGVTPRSRAVVARTCLIGGIVYIVAMIAGSRLADTQARQWLADRNIEAEIAMAGPIAVNPFVRDIVASTGERYHFLVVNWLSDAPIRESGPSVAIGERGPIVRAALESPDIQGTRRWLRLPSYDVQELADGYRVTIRDLRFARRARSGLGIVQVDLTWDLQLSSPTPAAGP